jgi:serine/threonine protein kinase
VLELCTGGSLEARLACKAAGAQLPPQPLKWEHRVNLAQGVAHALAHLHSRDPPIVHRDVKTANVLLDSEGNARVADFGISRVDVLKDSGGATHRTTAQRLGTTVYMPHEYYSHGHLSERTDSYAYGIVLVELLTGQPPMLAAERFTFEGPDVFDDMRGLADPKAGTWPPKVLKGIGAISKRCLTHITRDRATIAAVLPALKALRR